jgi:aminoglycoside 3-N-acetyltransferase I
MNAVATPSKPVVSRLRPGQTDRYAELMTLFGDAFDDDDTYTAARPDDDYVEARLADETFIALCAIEADRIVGGLAAYELKKFERARSEIYIYDLAVLAAHRRRGIATALIESVREIASARGAWTVVVQADVDDEPAVALYSALGEREEVLHFDIAPRSHRGAVDGG